MDICNAKRFANALPAFELEIFGMERVGRGEGMGKGRGRLEKGICATNRLTLRSKSGSGVLPLYANFLSDHGTYPFRGPFSSAAAWLHQRQTSLNKL